MGEGGEGDGETRRENPLLGAAFLFWGSPRIKKRQDRGDRVADSIGVGIPKA
jgi:hypothetical protein